MLEVFETSSTSIPLSSMSERTTDIRRSYSASEKASSGSTGSRINSSINFIALPFSLSSTQLTSSARPSSASVETCSLFAPELGVDPTL